MSKNNGGAAFPRPASSYYAEPQTGMNLRDWFAGQALSGLLSKNTQGKWSGAEGVERAAQCAFEYADAMISERNKK